MREGKGCSLLDVLKSQWVGQFTAWKLSAPLKAICIEGLVLEASSGPEVGPWGRGWVLWALTSRME